MTDITLWGRTNSANVQKVVWLLEELELPYEHVPLGGSYGGLDDPVYAAMNPNRKIPTLRDGTVMVWESHAIVRYLAATYASGLIWPVEPAERAVVDQWTDWTATAFQPAWLGLFWALVRTPEAQHDTAKIERLARESERLFAIMDGRLAEVPYLGGSQLTYADIVAGVAMYRWTTMPMERGEHRHVAAWHGRLAERRAFQKAVCLPYDELRGRTGY
jgi:glutathione S-transferase